MSPYGCLDMAGLVAEYCDSNFGSDPAFKVVRGGSYANPAVGSGWRTSQDASSRMQFVGMRPARIITE